MSTENKHSDQLEYRMSELVINEHSKKNEDKELQEVKCLNKKLTTCDNFIKDINTFGIAVLDGFLGQDRGDLVLEEVLQLHKSGLFQEGQLVRNNSKNNSIRGDEIVWLLGNEDRYPNIRGLINEIDDLIRMAKTFPNNGKLDKYEIRGRTKAMVACYPGNGAHYVKHVDNPNGDGRIITAIYYLNKDWDRKVHGGMLRIFPTDKCAQAADIDPTFDRMLFFWSDRRNPHEVQPSYRTRYAITIWYFDAIEKNKHLKLRQLERDTCEDQKKNKVES